MSLLLLNQLCAVAAAPDIRVMTQTRYPRGLGAVRGMRTAPAPSSSPIPSALGPLSSRAPWGTLPSSPRQPACPSTGLRLLQVTPRSAPVEQQLRRPATRTKRTLPMRRDEALLRHPPATLPLHEVSRCRQGYAGVRHTPPAPLPLSLPEAAERGDMTCVNAWLRYNQEIDAPDAHGFTALQHAVRNGRAEIVDILLSHNANLSVVTPNRETLLHLAAMSGDLAVLETIAACCNKAVNQPDNGGWTPLMYAVHHIDARLCQTLMGVTGIDVNRSNNQNRTALWLAADTGRTTTMAALLCREDIEVNCADIYGVTPLMSTTANGKVDRQALLLNDLRTDVNRQDQNGMTALMLAIKKKNPALHLNILAHPAVNAALQDDQGNTARRLLQAADIDVDKTNHAGLTPAMCALSQGYDQIVRLILEHRDRRYQKIH